MRDITLGETFYPFFTTRAFATGVPGTLSGTPALSVLEENNATPITAGVSVQVDRASVVGLNQATIVATSGNGYEAGKSYAVYISTGTVGGSSVVGEVVGEFTVQASAAFTRLGAPAGASVSADILTLDNLVDDLESRLGTPSNLGSGATVAANLVDIEGQTDDIGVAGAGLTAVPWNAAWDAEVQSEVDDALVAQRLDELVNADSDIDGAAPPTVGSVVFELLTKTAGSFTYDQATDSLEAIRDKETDIETDTAEIGAAGAGLTSLATQASVNTIDDLLDTEVALILTRLGTPAGASVSADIAGVPAAIGGRVAESVGSYTYDQVLRILLAVLAGVTSSNGAVLKTPDGTTTRVSATIDANNNRTAMSLTP